MCGSNHCPNHNHKSEVMRDLSSITCQPKALADTLAAVKPAVKAGASIQALTGVRITANENGVTMTATDLELFIRRELPATVDGEGSRWVLRQPIEKYPHFKAMPGMVGTITEGDCDLVRLKMDVELPGAEEWDNEIVWTEDDDPEGISALNGFMQDAELISETVAGLALEEKQGVELQIGNERVTVTHLTDEDGGHFLKLGGVNCDLDGEMPGEYYLKPRETAGSEELLVTLVVRLNNPERFDVTVEQVGSCLPFVDEVVFAGPGSMISEDVTDQR